MKKHPANNVPRKSPNQSNQIPFLLGAIRKWGLLAIPFGILLAAAAVAITIWIWEPVYEARKFVHVVLDQDYLSIVPERYQSKKSAKDELASVTSEVVLKKVLENPNIAGLPSLQSKSRSATPNSMQSKIALLRKMLRFESAGGSELFAIVCRNPNPKDAKILVETVTNMYLDYFKELRNNLLIDMTEKLDNAIAESNAEIEAIADKWSKLRLQLQADPQDSTLIVDQGQYLDQLKIVLFNLELEENQLVEELKDLRLSIEQEMLAVKETVDSVPEKVDVTPSDEKVATYVESSTTVRGLIERINFSENEKAKLSKLGEANPKIVQLNKIIRQDKKKLAEARQRVRDMYLFSFAKNEEQKASNKEISNARELARQIEAKEITLSGVVSRIAKCEEKMDDLGSKLVDYNILRNKFDDVNFDREKLKNDRDGFIRAKDEISIRRDLSLHNVMAVDGEPLLPTEPVERYPIKLLAMMFLAGIFLPFGLAVAWEFKVRRISSPDQIVERSHIEVVGETCELPSVGRGRTLKSRSRRTSRHLKLYEESIDSLSAVLSLSETNGVQILAITSAAANEGKTTLASQLAISVSRAHSERTLLIDSDLRSPSLHQLFDFPVAPGLVDVLSGEKDFLDAIVHTQISNLDVIPAGKLRSNPRRYFTNDEWADLLHEARSHYRHIIVDTPPLLAASESLIISKACDSVLVSVLRDVSRVDSVKKAVDRLLAANVNVNGCVFNGVPQGKYAYKYGSYGYNLSR